MCAVLVWDCVGVPEIVPVPLLIESELERLGVIVNSSELAPLVTTGCTEEAEFFTNTNVSEL